MLDVTLFGVRPAGPHLVNALLHGANAALLLLVFTALTGAVWRSLLVAALFAFHPLNVETVAWIAERKNVLSTCCWLLTMAFYLSYVRRPSPRRWLLVLLPAALGLMAKPMLVTLPFTLLLLDWWPLGRFVAGRLSPAPTFRRMVAEKWPLFLLAAGAGVLTLIAQSTGGAVASLEKFSIGGRLANALAAAAGYLAKMIWPAGLAVFYPHLGGRLPWFTRQRRRSSSRGSRSRPTAGAVAGRHCSGAGSGTSDAGAGCGADPGRQAGDRRPLRLCDADRPVRGGGLVPPRRPDDATGPGRGRIGCGGCGRDPLRLTARHLPVWENDITLFNQALRVNRDSPGRTSNSGTPCGVAAGSTKRWPTIGAPWQFARSAGMRGSIWRTSS